LLEILATSDSIPWSSSYPRGSRLRKALEAAFVIAWEAGGPCIGLSLRQHVETSGIDYSTLRRDRTRLARYGWWSKLPGRTERGAHRFALRVPSPTHLVTVAQSPGGGTVLTPVSGDCVTAHDVWRGLGDEAWYALHALTCMSMQKSARIALVEERTGLRRTVLGSLAEHGIVKLTATKARVVDDHLRRMDLAAVALGVHGLGAETRARHLREREEYATAREVRRARAVVADLDAIVLKARERATA
jgi:hypothetical protein